MKVKHEYFPDTHHDVSSNTVFGFWLYLMTDCIMFATFFAAYAVLQSGTYGGATARDLFDLSFVLTETLILLASSFTCGIAMLVETQKSKKQMIAWFAATFLLGLAFMGMEIEEFRRLIAEGHTWQKSAFLSSYFTLIATHGLHIVVGLVLLVVFAAQLIARGLTTVIARRLTCFRIYWQFLYLIWIFTFTIVYLIGVG